LNKKYKNNVIILVGKMVVFFPPLLIFQMDLFPIVPLIVFVVKVKSSSALGCCYWSLPLLLLSVAVV
jgi:hypothetical protein